MKSTAKQTKKNVGFMQRELVSPTLVEFFKKAKGLKVLIFLNLTSKSLHLLLFLCHYFFSSY